MPGATDNKKMLAALDSIILQDRGGRRLFLLRQLWSLYLSVGSKCDPAQTAVFDSVLATAAHDVDYSIMQELAPEADRLPYGLPVFAAAVSGQPMAPMTLLPPAPASPPDEIVKPEPDMPVQPAQVVSVQEPVAEAAPIAVAAAVVEPPAPPAATTHPDTLPSVEKPVPAAAEAPPPPQRVERRARDRDPVEDANNPITLARKASLEELARIAELPNLPETITNVIVARGDRTILGKALANKTAAFARSSLTTLAELAPSDRMIREALVARQDLPEPIIERLLPFLSPDKRAVLLTNGAPFSETAAREALVQAQADLLQASRSGHLMLTLDGFRSMMDENKLATNDVVLTLARDVRLAELAAFAASTLAIKEATAFNIFSGRLDHATAVLLKAMGCDGVSIEQVMVMRSRLGCREAKETRSAFMVAQRYSVESAIDLTRQMDRAIRLPHCASEGGKERSLLDDFDAILRRAA